MAESKLWDDIQAQGDNLARVIAHLYGPERSRLERAAAFLTPGRPTAFIGVASAAYLCHPAAYYLGEHGRYASVIYAADAAYHLLPALARAHVVINSRSGETAEIVRLGQALVDAGIPFLAITNEPGSTLAQMAARHPHSAILWSNTRKDELVSINVVTGMMTATLALAAASVGELDSLRPDLARLPELLTALTQLSQETRDAMLQLFRAARPIHLLWRGPLKAAAYCGRLALEEVARTPGVPVEGSEFRQGPNEVVDERFAAAIFIANGRPGELSRSLAAEITRQGGRALLIGDVPGAAPRGSLVIPTPGLPDALLPIAQVVPLQILAHDLALNQGYAPGTVRYISKIITDEESHESRK